MSTFSGGSVSFSIGGVPFDGITSVSYERREPKPAKPALEPRVYEATATMHVERDAYQKLLYALTPPQRGVSDATLAKRTRYGGRKARSAWRRLRAKGYVGVATVGAGVVIPVTLAMARRVMDDAVERSRRLLENAINSSLRAASALADLEEKVRRELNQVILGV